MVDASAVVLELPEIAVEAEQAARRAVLQERVQEDDALAPLVGAIDERAGREGLLDLIARAEAGGDFERLLQDISR